VKAANFAICQEAFALYTWLFFALEKFPARRAVGRLVDWTVRVHLRKYQVPQALPVGRIFVSSRLLGFFSVAKASFLLIFFPPRLIFFNRWHAAFSPEADSGVSGMLIIRVWIVLPGSFGRLLAVFV
jgi:hypothetical protein